MEIAEFRDILANIKYKPGFFINSNCAMNYEVQCAITINMHVKDVTKEVQDIPITIMMRFTEDGLKELTEKELLHIVHKLLRNLEEHECDEQFLYRNERIFDPHKILTTTVKLGLP